jgi:thiamine pyrophosphate-dependent acetolactate synthase large subunit-like protein
MELIGAGEGLERRAVVRALLEGRERLLVVAGLGSVSYDVFAAGDHDANFYLWGAMGSAALVGLGLALAQPARPVAVITGDGEQLMGLGGLATIAVKRPSNLTVVVLDNRHYAETGMQTSHTGLGVSLDRVAAALDFPRTVAVATMDQIAALRHSMHEAVGGPRFATIRIRAENPPRVLPPRDAVFLKNRFRMHLGSIVT